MECIRSTYFYYWLSNLCKPGSQPRLAKPSGSFLPLCGSLCYFHLSLHSRFLICLSLTLLACMYSVPSLISVGWIVESVNSPMSTCILQIMHHWAYFITLISSFGYKMHLCMVPYLHWFISFDIFYLYDEQSVIARFCIVTQCAAILLFCAVSVMPVQTFINIFNQ